MSVTVRQFWGTFIITAILILFVAAAGAQGLTVDMLLARIATGPDTQPYSMTAEFTSRLTLTGPTGTFVIPGTGSMVEARANGEQRRRKITLTTLQVPLLLRPFTNGLRDAVRELIEADNRAVEFLGTQDVFVGDEAASGRYALGGVRTDIVTEVMTRYGQTGMLRDPTARRAIAKWLHAPSQRASIVRGGTGPYILSAVVDETGVIHDLTLFYDWGQVRNHVTYMTVGGRPFWRDFNTDTSRQVAGIGRVDANLVVNFANHCLNCQTR